MNRRKEFPVAHTKYWAYQPTNPAVVVVALIIYTISSNGFVSASITRLTAKHKRLYNQAYTIILHAS